MLIMHYCRPSKKEAGKERRRSRSHSRLRRRSRSRSREKRRSRSRSRVRRRSGAARSRSRNVRRRISRSRSRHRRSAKISRNRSRDRRAARSSRRSPARRPERRRSHSRGRRRSSTRSRCASSSPLPVILLYEGPGLSPKGCAGQLGNVKLSGRRQESAAASDCVAAPRAALQRELQRTQSGSQRQRRTLRRKWTRRRHARPMVQMATQLQSSRRRRPVVVRIIEMQMGTGQ